MGPKIKFKTYDEAFDAMYEFMQKESAKTMNIEVKRLRGRGIPVVTLEEAIKDMTPEELEHFKEERNRKYMMPLMVQNIKMLKQKARQHIII
jgi:hypothetical protein